MERVVSLHTNKIAVTEQDNMCDGLYYKDYYYGKTKLFLIRDKMVNADLGGYRTGRYQSAESKILVEIINPFANEQQVNWWYDGKNMRRGLDNKTQIHSTFIKISDTMVEVCVDAIKYKVFHYTTNIPTNREEYAAFIKEYESRLQQIDDELTLALL
jgi:hypothetical protein